MIRRFIVFCCLTLAAGALPVEVRKALEEPRSVDLVSLHPTPKSNTGLHGFQELGRVCLGQEEARRACSAVWAGLQDGERGNVPTCFQPRHALRIGELDLLICYQCHHWVAYLQGHRVGEGAISDGGQEECEQAVIEHGLDFQGWARWDGRLYHTSGFSLDIPYGFQPGQRDTDESLLLMGPGDFRGNPEHWFHTEGHGGPLEALGFREGEPLAMFDFSEQAFVHFLVPTDAASARLRLTQACQRWQGPALRETAPDVWTSFGNHHLYAVGLIERQGKVLHFRADMPGEEVRQRARLEEILSSIQYHPRRP